MIARPLLVLAALLLMVPLAPGALATAQNDAGMPGDAPNSAFGPGRWISFGTQTGQVLYNEGDDQDWYHLSSPCGHVQITFRATSGSLWGGLYRLGESGLISIQNIQNWGTSTSTFTLVGPQAHDYFLTFGESGRATGTASYTATITEVPARDDAPETCDAGGWMDSAHEARPGTYTGHVEGNDDSDWYAFPGECGLVATISSLSGATFWAAIYMRNPWQPTAASVIESGDVSGTRTLTGYGASTLYVAVSRYADPADYRIVLARMNDAGTGCDGSATSAAAALVGTGSKTGKLHYDLDDHEDWFRFAQGCTNARVVASVSDKYAYAAIHDNNGALLQERFLEAGQSVTFDVVANGFRLRLGDPWASVDRGTYAFSISVLSTDPTGASCAYPTAVAI